MILGIDPGAERMGWCLMTYEGEYVDSGCWKQPKIDGETYQNYRLRIERESTIIFVSFFEEHDDVTLIVNEILPATGFSNSVQAYLANVVLACLHSVAAMIAIDVVQIAAISVKVRIAGTKKATKVAVRNSIIQLFPILANRKKDWTKEFDEPDAIAVAASYVKGK